jgi:hypothetical protein
MRSLGPRLAVLAVASAVWLGAAPAASAAPPGFDLFETDPQSTTFSFTDEFSLPAGFFAPGSQPFSGRVNFGGVPLEKFQGHATGDADTVVHRPQAANLEPPFPAHDTIPIELVGLSLQSVAPIQVRVGNATQAWDVKVDLSPSRPSQGQMTIVKQSEAGGTFDSQLLVFPRFTFVRRPGGQTRTIDVGQLQLQPTSLQSLLLQGNGVPWRAGCTLPALAVPGLNDGFCPSFTPTGQKQLTLEQALRAQHGVYPVQPALEHFKCYRVEPTVPFKSRDVQLVDQFGAASARVVKPVSLCNPVRKNRERFANRRAHLECYSIKQAGKVKRETVLVRNQFGPDTLTVNKPKSLCVPSRKDVVGKPPGKNPTVLTDHFKCYSVTGQAKLGRVKVKLTDQFHVERVLVVKPAELCNPVQKNAEPSQHPVRHLVCYSISDPGRSLFEPRQVRTSNQFGKELLNVVAPRRLCVPSVKLRLQ